MSTNWVTKVISWSQQHSDTKVRDTTRKVQASNPDERDAKYLGKQIQQHMQRIISTIKWDLSLGCKDGSTYANQSIWYTTFTERRLKPHEHLKNPGQNSTSSQEKNSHHNSIEGTYLSATKNTSGKPRANIVIKGGSESLEMLPALTSQHRTEALARVIW